MVNSERAADFTDPEETYVTHRVKSEKLLSTVKPTHKTTGAISLTTRVKLNHNISI